jgi:hypothetical protein
VEHLSAQLATAQRTLAEAQAAAAAGTPSRWGSIGRLITGRSPGTEGPSPSPGGGAGSHRSSRSGGASPSGSPRGGVGAATPQQQLFGAPSPSRLGQQPGGDESAVGAAGAADKRRVTVACVQASPAQQERAVQTAMAESLAGKQRKAAAGLLAGAAAAEAAQLEQGPLIKAVGLHSGGAGLPAVPFSEAETVKQAVQQQQQQEQQRETEGPAGPASSGGAEAMQLGSRPGGSGLEAPDVTGSALSCGAPGSRAGGLATSPPQASSPESAEQPPQAAAPPPGLQAPAGPAHPPAGPPAPTPPLLGAAAAVEPLPSHATSQQQVAGQGLGGEGEQQAATQPACPTRQQQQQGQQQMQAAPVQDQCKEGEQQRQVQQQAAGVLPGPCISVLVPLAPPPARPRGRGRSGGKPAGVEYREYDYCPATNAFALPGSDGVAEPLEPLLKVRRPLCCRCWWVLGKSRCFAACPASHPV